jgi:hypothetical protein
MSIDLLSGVAAISRYLYGDASTPHQRRVRHLVRIGAIPHRKVAGRIETRRSWVEAAYAEPDPVPEQPPPPAPALPEAPPGMLTRSDCVVCHLPIFTYAARGRPPRYHTECRPTRDRRKESRGPA